MPQSRDRMIIERMEIDIDQDVAVVILAGGEGRRIGGGKPLRSLQGRTLLDRAIEQAHRWSSTVAIAARSPCQLGETQVRLLIDPPDIAGPLAGLVSARTLGFPLTLTMPCDMPFLPADLLSRLAEALPGHGASLASSGGQVHPVCGLWDGAALKSLDAYLSGGRRSVIGFAEAVGYASVEWADTVFANVNTPQELERAEAHWTGAMGRLSGSDGRAEAAR